MARPRPLPALASLRVYFTRISIIDTQDVQRSDDHDHSNTTKVFQCNTNRPAWRQFLEKDYHDVVIGCAWLEDLVFDITRHQINQVFDLKQLRETTLGLCLHELGIQCKKGCS